MVAMISHNRGRILMADVAFALKVSESFAY